MWGRGQEASSIRNMRARQWACSSDQQLNGKRCPGRMGDDTCRPARASNMSVGRLLELGLGAAGVNAGRGQALTSRRPKKRSANQNGA